MTDIIDRLKDACNGHPHAKIAWPHRLLHDAIAEITTLRARVSELLGFNNEFEQRARVAERVAKGIPQWDWIPIEKVTATGKYLVGHRGHQEVIYFFGTDRDWLPHTMIGWQGRDPATFRATHAVMIVTPEKQKMTDQFIEHDGQRLILNPDLVRPRPISEYHEDMGDVLWWQFPIVEAPYVGTPNDLGFEVTMTPHVSIGTSEPETKDDPSFVGSTHQFHVGGWPGYHTHFTPIPMPEAPKP